MGKKGKKFVEWQKEKEAEANPPKPEPIGDAFKKRKSKKPLIRSSHR